MESTNRFANLWFAGGIGTLLAVVFAAVVYLIATASGDPLSVASQPGSEEYAELPFGAVIVATVVACLIATGFAWIAKKTSSPLVVFLTLVVVGFLLMLYPPIASAEQASTTGWLILMHAAVAAPIVGTLTVHLRVVEADAVASTST
ncbi:MAG: DUF6069 family protein [Acidimicrobiia bacterium]|nr:DUF6069 family protein [Acidimicrobiia bacterium]